ncbi:MAG: hypothetical protein JSR17_00940 [Proteobacteria bacterium]|nr:hypothetical protein [Pseudomonadota bacterium]
MSFYRNDPNILNEDFGDFDRMGSVTRNARKNERPLFSGDINENEFDETRGGNNFGNSNEIQATNNFNQFVSDYADSGFKRVDAEKNIQSPGNFSGFISDECGCLYKKGNPTPYKICDLHFQNKIEQSRGFGIDSRHEMSLNPNVSIHQLQNIPRQDQFQQQQQTFSHNQFRQQHQQHQQHQQQQHHVGCNCYNYQHRNGSQSASPFQSQYRQPQYNHSQHYQIQQRKPQIQCVGNQCRRV